MITPTTTSPAPYSPVVEAERAVRLAVAAHALGGFWQSGLRQALRRADAAPVTRHLDGVIRVLVREGWTQGQMRDENGICLFKALTVAAEAGFGDHPERPDVPPSLNTHYVAGRYLDLMVLARTGRPDWYLGWNDASGRTVGEVLELVQDAAAFASYVRRPVAADDHGKVKDPLPPRPRGPHPYRVGVVA